MNSTPADRHRILFAIARGDAFGGSSLHVMAMADRLREAGHETRILVGGHPDMEVPKRFAERDLDFRCIPSMGRELHPIRDLRSVLAIRREIRSFRPDLVSLHASKAGGLGRLAAAGTGVPVIYTPHCWSFVEEFPKARLYRGLERRLAPLARRIVTVSDDERVFGLLSGVGNPDQLVTVHNGVEDAFHEAEPDRVSDDGTIRIVMVGRFENQKDQRSLVRALDIMRELPWRLTLVGDGPLRDDCVELVRQRGLEDRVEFVGYSARVEEILARHDLFALVSRWEGLPRSILEAMSASLPVLANDVGGCRETIEQDVTGKLVAPDDFEALCRSLRELLEDPARLREMGRQGRRKYLEEFHFETMYSRYIDLYDEVISEKPARAARRSEARTEKPAVPALAAAGGVAPRMEDLAVLIPSYNDTPALRETLASIREEDSSFTVFVVDDGSCEPVRLDPADYPFALRVLRLEKNAGIVGALNAGLEKIREEGFRFVARLDAADRNRPGRFRLQYERLCEDPTLSIVGSNVVFRDEDSGEPDFTTRLPLTPAETRRWIVFRNSFIHPAVMFRTKVLDESGLYDARYPHIEDYVLFSRILRRHRGANLEEALVDCQIRAGGISRKHYKAQMLSGFRYKLAEDPRPLDPLWYAFLLKRVTSILVPHGARTALKQALGFAKSAPATKTGDTPLAGNA